ncbi:MAG: anthranilate synthase component I family protein, partial [Nevskiales bacterium]
MTGAAVQQAVRRRRVPLVREVLADLDTPLSTYLKLANGPYSYLLESVVGGEQWGRYSIIGLPCRELIEARGGEITVRRDGQVIERAQVSNPLDWVRDYAARFEVPVLPGLPRLTGGLVGYFSYDSVRYIEPRLAGSTPADMLGTPDILLMLSEELVVFDNVSGTLYVIVHADADSNADRQRAETRLDELLHKLRQPLQQPQEPAAAGTAISETDFVSGFSQQGFEAAVTRIREYIAAGDVMQVVLSQRLSIPFRRSPLDLYRVLRGLNPSPYLYLMNLGDHHVVGSSPEILVRVEDGKLTVRPIAGTRPRGKTAEEDKALEQDLLNDPKEIAEHLMLIDLGRNDVGRVSKTGTVKVTERMGIERYSHVMHIVSNVVGELKPGLSAIDALEATLPAGTLSGAPKVRAMEI